MSDLLNQASLVMVPSGYKEDIVYSVVPSDGSGDLSFTRASNGTRVNSAGLVEVCPWNLIQYSEQFTNGVWAPKNGTFTDNFATAPNGTQTAAKMVATDSDPFIYQAFNGQNIDYTVTCWVKATGTAIGKNCSIRIAGNAVFVAMTGEWQQLTITGNINGSVNVGVEAPESATIGEIVYIWGFQVNIGSTAKPYFPTTDRLNVPRLTYQNGGGGCPSLLLEKQSTNLLTYSEQFDNSAWVKASVTVSANQATSPDGTQNADLIYPTSSASNLGTYQYNSSIIGVVGTVSCYVKSAGKNWALLGTDNTSAYNVSFDLVNGVVGSVPSGYTATIESVGNGWYRITATFQSGSSLAYPFVGVADNTNRSVTADGTNGLYIWGFQAEVSSYPTSYIPTTSSSATRVADACFKTGISSLIGQTEGTIFCDFVWEGLGTANVDNAIFSIGEQSYGTSNIAISNYNGALYGRVTNGVSVDATVAFGSMTIGGRYKCAIGYANNDFVFYVNGANIGNDTSVSIPTLSDAYFQNSYPNSKEVNQVVLFKTRLTNAELASLTTI